MIQEKGTWQKVVQRFLYPWLLLVLQVGFGSLGEPPSWAPSIWGSATPSRTKDNKSPDAKTPPTHSHSMIVKACWLPSRPPQTPDTVKGQPQHHLDHKFTWMWKHLWLVACGKLLIKFTADITLLTNFQVVNFCWYFKLWTFADITFKLWTFADINKLVHSSNLKGLGHWDKEEKD